MHFESRRAPNKLNDDDAYMDRIWLATLNLTWRRDVFSTIIVAIITAHARKIACDHVMCDNVVQFRWRRISFRLFFFYFQLQLIAYDRLSWWPPKLNLQNRNREKKNTFAINIREIIVTFTWKGIICDWMKYQKLSPISLHNSFSVAETKHGQKSVAIFSQCDSPMNNVSLSRR